MIVDRIKAALDRDPAARGFWGVIEVILTYAGFHALLFHDFAHLLAKLRVPLIPRVVSQFARFLTGVEIHPAAKIGRGVFIDHGAGVVIGETAVVGEGSTIFQGVTLGGTGKATGKRHPTVGRNVVIGVGASVLGNVTIGDNSYIGAGAVVLKDVPAGSTAVGVPARIVRMEGRKVLGATLDHTSLPDPVLERLQALQDELERAERMIELEAGLPHVLLALSAENRTAARATIEHLLDTRRVSYAVQDCGDRVRLTAFLSWLDYSALRREMEALPRLTVLSEGREESLRAGEEEPAPGAARREIGDGRIIKLVIVLTAG